MCTKMLLLCGAVCLLSVPVQARGSDAACETREAIDKDVGESHAFVFDSYQAITCNETIENVFTIQCPCNVQVPASVGCQCAETKSGVALRPAQNKPSLRAAGLLRPGWRHDAKSCSILNKLNSQNNISILQNGGSTGGPGLMCSRRAS